MRCSVCAIRRTWVYTNKKLTHNTTIDVIYGLYVHVGCLCIVKNFIPTHKAADKLLTCFPFSFTVQPVQSIYISLMIDQNFLV